MPKLADPAVYPAIAPTDDDQLLFRTGAGGDGRAALVQPKGYIDGLRMEWVSATQVRVSTGSAYVPGAKRIAELVAPVTLTPSLAANSWYHIYLTVAGAVVGVEAVATAPAAPYFGTARAKTGDTSRRYVGSLRTDAGGVIAKFKHNPAANYIAYIAIRESSLNGGTQAVTTPVSLSAPLPVTATFAALIISLDATGAALFTGNSEMTDTVLSASNFLGYTESSTQVSVSRMDGHPVDANQSITYRLSAAPSSGTGAYIRVMGYSYER